MKKIFLGPSGGTAAGMGAFQNYFCSNLWQYQVFFVPEMWRTMIGLTNRTPIESNAFLLKDWDAIGGSPIIPSCKDTNVFKIEMDDGAIVDLSDRVKEFCDGAEGIVAVGGDGTTFQAQELKEKQDINTNVVLATMDNNIVCFDNVIGFETAVLNSSNSIQACVNDAYTMQRPTIVYSMGYDTGRLSVAAVRRAKKLLKAYDGRINLLQIPETETATEDVAKKILETYSGHGQYIAVIAEGCAKVIEGSDNGKHKTYDTNAYTKKLENLTGIEFKELHTDYIQRSGAPCAKDIELAKKFAFKAADLVRKGKWNYVVGSLNGKVIAKPVEEVSYIQRNEKPSLKEWYDTPFILLDGVKDILVT